MIECSRRHQAANKATMSDECEPKEEPELPVLTAESVYDDAFPTDLFIRIGGYWNGKDFSSYLLAAEASKVLRSNSHLEGTSEGILKTPTVLRSNSHLEETSEGILNALTDRCSKFLESVDASDRFKDVWKERSHDALQDLIALRAMARYMESVSQWCAFLDYCETSGIRLWRTRLAQDKPIKPIWIIGSGEFGPSDSPSILSVPAQNWRPEHLFLAEKWMVDYTKTNPLLTQAFPMAIPEMLQNVQNNVAIMSWNDGKFLQLMHDRYDISAGMMVYHEYGEQGRESNNQNDFVEGSHLNWMTNLWCQMYPIRDALGKSEKLNWLLEGIVWDNNHLAYIEINEATVPDDHMDGFGGRIVKLMKVAEEWYADDESSAGTFESSDSDDNAGDSDD